MDTTEETFIILWIMCGILHYGIFFAHFQRKYQMTAEKNYRRDMILGMITGLLGPIASFSTPLNGFYKHGFKWR